MPAPAGPPVSQQKKASVSFHSKAEAKKTDYRRQLTEYYAFVVKKSVAVKDALHTPERVEALNSTLSDKKRYHTVIQIGFSQSGIVLFCKLFVSKSCRLAIWHRGPIKQNDLVDVVTRVLGLPMQI